MKFLADLLPVILFFVAFKIAGTYPDAAAELGSQYLGGLVSGGMVHPAQAPILWATVVTIAVTLLQVVSLLARGRRVEPMLWISLAIVAVFGGATIWFQNETFIKWKPTILYWAFSGVLGVSAFLMRQNLLRKLMGQQITLPEPVWKTLNLAWVLFFMVMGWVNLYIAFRFPTDVWVQFKAFGMTAAMLIFILAQSLWLSRHLKEPGENR